MRFGDIKFPDSLCRAIEKGEVVVFAGAGVSYPAPSDLPLFDGLATLVADGTGMSRQMREITSKKPGERYFEVEAIDRFLGRLEQGGVDIRSQAKRRLSGPHTSPNSLHSSIVRLFQKIENLRIVTTNFDNHLSTRIPIEHHQSVRQYVSPTLPRGDDFTGIVYLHGSVHHRVEDCILTDEDFGQAYLIGGWARRFLVSMFEKYSVLFVGYSHNDPVMNYLARGLPETKKRPRFALVPAGEEAQWRFLKIDPIPYCSENNHAALATALDKCADYFQTGVLEKVARVKSAAAADPPGDFGIQDNLCYELSDPVLAGPFLAIAKGNEWIKWLNEKGFLLHLFNPLTEENDHLKVFAEWFVSNITQGHSDVLYGIVERRGLTDLHPLLCRLIGHLLLYRKGALEHQSFCKWVTILMAQSVCKLPNHFCAQLLGECTSDHDRGLVPRVFDHACKFEVQLQQSGSKVHPAFPRDAAQYLRSSWKDAIAPRLPILAERLLSIIGDRLSEVYDLLGIDHQERTLSWQRSSIEPHSQDSYWRHDCIHFLVDSARDALRALQDSGATTAFQIIQVWMNSSCSLLVRLAIHALARDEGVTSDAKIQLMVERNWLFDRLLRTEVFFLLKKCYSSSNDQTRVLLISAIEGQISGCPEDESSHETWEYEIFNLLGWLATHASECSLAVQAFSRAESRRPDFRRREHPDLSSWVASGLRSVESELNLDVILTNEPSDFVDEIANIVDDPSATRSPHRDYESALRQLIVRDVDWGLRCHRLLRERGIDAPNLWRQVCNGWREAQPNQDQWGLIFDEFLSKYSSRSLWLGISAVLENWVRRAEQGIPDELLARADALARRVWREYLSSTPVDEDAMYSDWLTIALNRPGGSYAEYLMLRLEQIRKKSDDRLNAIPDETKEALSEVIDSASGAGEMGRVLIAAQVRWLNLIDSDFVARKVVPLFDWTLDERRAEQCWHGFLRWGAWDDAILTLLLPSFEETLKRAYRIGSEESGGLAERIAEHLAYLAFDMVEKPMSKNWLLGCLKQLRVDHRVAFARAVCEHIESSSPERAETCWREWIAPYLQAAVDGVMPMDPEEANRMALWLMHLAPKGVNGLEFLTPLVKKGDLSQSGWMLEIKRLGLHRTDIHATCTLVLAYLESNPAYFRVDKTFREIWAELKNNVDEESLRALKVALVRLGVDLDSLDK